MKKLLILSGKGGTGKTTTAAAFIRFSNSLAFADCDVDAPNLHMVTSLDATPESSDYIGSKKAKISTQTCISCGRCMEICRFDAIQKINGSYKINEYACEGCGVCAYVCPEKSIELQDDIAGYLKLYRDTRVFSTARLKMGRGNSGKLVSAVKTALLDAAPKTDLAIIDGSPGIGCPVIASISGVDFILLVVEPSISGMSDMERILETAGMLQTKVAVCVNKYDTSPENTEKIEAFCKNNNIPFVGNIPYDTQAYLAINTGKSLADVNCPATTALRNVFHKMMKLIYINAE